jgi:hypothetical protein
MRGSGVLEVMGYQGEATFPPGLGARRQTMYAYHLPPGLGAGGRGEEHLRPQSKLHPLISLHSPPLCGIIALQGTFC